MAQIGDLAEKRCPIGRVLAVDLGTVRVGLAVSDSGRLLASPHAVLEPSSEDELIAAIQQTVEELVIAQVVVGLPLGLSGAPGRAAERTVEFVKALQARLSVPVLAFDERLSTVEATRLRRSTAGGPSSGRPRRPKSSRARRAIDDQAAAVFLQAFLDTERGRA